MRSSGGTLAALLACVFAIGSAEYAVLGVLPDIAGDLRVSVGTTGLLVTGYALTVAFAGPVFTALTTRVPRKALLIGMIALFAAGNVLAALAGSFGLVLIARVVAALVHSTFFAVGLVQAVSVVGAERRGWAIAVVSAGLNLATVLGAPLGTFIGHELGWRATFWAVAGASAVAAGLIVVAVPRSSAVGPQSVRAEIGALADREVLVVVAVTVLAQIALFTPYTYIATILTEVSGFATGAVAWLLMAFGAGGLVGNVIGGRLADRWPWGSVRGLLAGMVFVLGVFALVVQYAGAAAVGVLVLGVVSCALIPALQSRAFAAAAAAPTLTVAVNTSAFNLGNAGGAWIGGRVLDGGAAPHWLIGIGIFAAVAAWVATAARRSAGVEGRTDVAVV
ncbi:MFS transporter, DHA1 family, inner membrane transport protein [Saccharopolyspora antimicrobica]|uniref:DHA1 family inner membrane transport protein n=1 Tax=Saccharopolyspora antimicrobica TaxID=455193 RepID=A0A1I4ZXE5_9PSEU|nr:MFS transporter [Saccharopolyspora antimicrobica]RKT83361.1 DHA1 family inner membrane transport protein [Saccharopolyspora antimicrobica]SFN54882.1 MFS transporter, DHA1 family, inner membrane transport protein [Saccharopolyspora antimicrobica]